MATNIETLTSQSTRSPLRYPGGKSQAIRMIFPIIEAQSPTRLISPFLGGGSIELAVANVGIPVIGYDGFELLANFWHFALKDAEQMADESEMYLPMTKDKFRIMQRDIMGVDAFTQAVWFYVVNRCSRSGLSFSGGYSGERFTSVAIKKLRDFICPNLEVRHQDFRKTLLDYPNDLLYLDPPYYNCSNLYGIRGSHSNNFPHDELAEVLATRGKFILSYNDTPKIRELYKHHRICDLRWHWGMKNGEQGTEVLILSDDIKLPPQWEVTPKIVDSHCGRPITLI